MPSFSVNAHRFDPYKGFKFRVRWDGRAIPDVHRVTGLRWAPPKPWPAADQSPSFSVIERPSASGSNRVGAAITGLLARLPTIPRSTRAISGRSLPAPVTHWTHVALERGRTHDRSFEAWAAGAAAAALAGQGGDSVEKDVVIEVQNEAGQTALAFNLSGCVPVEYVPIGELNANRASVLLERLVLAYDNAERDLEVFEPVEFAATEPKG